MKPYMSVVNQVGEKETITLDKGIENALLQIFKSQAPVNIGTLKGQIRVEREDNTIRIISDIYYTPYTTEKWGYHRGWRKTLTNPNEGWWQNAYALALRFLGIVYGKEFKRES